MDTSEQWVDDEPDVAPELPAKDFEVFPIDEGPLSPITKIHPREILPAPDGTGLPVFTWHCPDCNFGHAARFKGPALCRCGKMIDLV